jgi:hypothetical protein
MKQIIWNGCDGYIDPEGQVARFGGYDIRKEMDGSYTLFHGAQQFSSFEVEEVRKEDLPSEDGDLTGIFYTEEDGKYWRSRRHQHDA